MGLRYLLVTWDGGGNVPPELGLARRLIARGHAVHVLGDPTLEADVVAAGCSFGPWMTAPHRTTRDRSADLIRDYEYKNPLASLDVYMQEFLAAPSPRWIADVLRELQAHPADVVLGDFAIPSALIAAEKEGLPSAMIMPNIWILPTPGIPPIGPGFAPARGPLGRLRDAILRRIMNRMFDKAVPHFNAARAALGLPPIRSAIGQMMRADRLLCLTSPAFDFTSPSLPPNLSYVGPQLDDPNWSEPWRSPWPAGDTRPLVLVGLSSTFQDQAAALRNVVAALAMLPVRGLVTLGHTIGADEVEGRGNVVVVRSAPHTQVLREAAALVTHCGHGTALKGLASGVPMVCMPMGRDQNDTAARIVHRGAGLRLAPKAKAPKIAAAVARVLREPSYRQAARGLGDAIARGEGCADPVTVLEGLAAARRAAA
jgi:MGT family glycosyltransferase